MLNNFKFIKNITDSGEATIVLYNQIGDSINSDGNYTVGISGTAFANEMQYLQNNSKKINIVSNVSDVSDVSEQSQSEVEEEIKLLLKKTIMFLL